ncbi:hypothetical protein [Amycolatopsis vastitatis]|uniref:hypothetical protein n=1 Tax=Amycolatopsis vastitatis TaxID=1905142 RepID=UPI001F0A7D8D|nr:hypothetical protein [Amycolatopsis vastitatis]
MPARPVVPVLAVAALAYVLVEQSALDLGITAGVLWCRRCTGGATCGAVPSGGS